MTDTFDLGPDPSDFLRRGRQRAMGEAMTSLEDDPQKVGRAYELGRATGDSPALVYADLDNYEVQHKAALTSQLLNSNAHLREYLDADPMHAKLSNDDYANLDTISGKIASFRKITHEGVGGLPTRTAEGILGSAWKGFHEGIGEGPIGSWVTTVPQLKDQRLWQSVLATGAAPIEIPFRFLAGGIHAATEGAKAGAKEVYQTFTGDEQRAEQFARDIAGMVEMQITGVGVHKPGIAPEAIKKAHDALISTKLWNESGREPPAGLNPTIDKLKLEQNNADIANLDEMLRDAQSSATRERDPETFARFIRMRDEGTIAIDSEAISKLYGDKVPHGEDGLLGWEPSLEAQLATAKATGADVEVPIADFLAKVDPEVYKALKDDIRVRPGGITKNEAKVANEQRVEVEGKLEILPEDLPQLRAHAGLEPLFSIGDRKLELKRIAAKQGAMFGPEAGFHDFNILDENGGKVAALNVSLQREGKDVYVEGIEGINGHTTRSFGPALMKDLKTQIKAEFPEAERIGGHRVSGMREKFETFDKPQAMVWVKLDNPSGWGHVEAQAFRDILEGGEWKPLGQGLTAYMRPTEAMTARQKDVAKAINEELGRLTPKQVDVATPQQIKNAAGREVRGVHMQYTDRNPFIIVALDSQDPIGVARHEAIHHLRQQGFFTEGEWDTLARAARDNGWIEKFGIERRYSTLDTPAKLEEAIADGFRSWKDGQPIPERVRPIFERLKELFESIHTQLKEIFGKELSWEELFQKVDEGEIGQREGNAPRREGAYKESTEGKEVLYHGTSKDASFSKLKDSRNGTWFTTDPKEASTYAVENDSQGYRHVPGTAYGLEKTNTASRVIPMTHDFQNTLVLKEWPKELIEATNYKRAQGDYFDKLRREGYDSVRMNTENGHSIVVALDNTKLTPRYAPDKVKGAKFSVDDRVLPQDERPLFRTPATIGMTAKQEALYQRAIRDMHESDIEWAQGKAEKEQRKRLTAEWKQDYKNTHSEVEADMNARPDVAADLFFARGELYGERISPKPKIAFESLTLEERAALPKDYVAKAKEGGVELDDIASLVGFPSGRAMVEHLIAYNQTKLTANMSAKAFRDRMVDLETERQMAGKHGDLEQNILDEAKDQVTSETQLNMLAQDVLALGIKANLEATINKAELRKAVQDAFSELPMAGQTSDKYLKAAGKKGTAADIAHLKGHVSGSAADVAEAYREKSDQFTAMMFAAEARKLEKEQKQFGNLAKRLSKRDVKGLNQEYQDVIQGLLWQAGLTPRRTMLEIQRSQAQSGFTGLDSFLDSATADGWAPEVGADIIAGRTKPIDQMTVEEFREFKDAITSLNWIGRQVEKINVKGAAEDFAVYRDKVVANITSLPRRSRESQESGLAHRMYSIDATLTRMENVMKDLDLGEDMGPLVDATIRPMAEAKHKEYSLQEGLSKQIKDLNASLPKEWSKALDETLPNDWFVNPTDGNLFKLSRMDLVNIMLNWGNKGNLKKFTHGYGSPDPVRQATKAEAAAFEQKMKSYIDTHATREDWKFVQGVWDIYEGYRADMEQVWRNTAGTQPKLVEPVAVDSPHGQFKGGYYPLIRDQYMSPLPRKGTGEELFGPDYPNFSTPQGHLKERTGATYFVDFQQPLGRIPMRMQQVIHDIAYRDAVMAAAKVVRDKSIKGAIINHYGKEYADQLEPWLQKTARGSTIDEANQKGIDSILRQARLNLVGYALPWNYVVTLTPDVGSINPKVLANYYRDKQGNDALANRLSKEIPHAMYNMDRDFKEAMQKAVGEGKLDDYRTKVARWGYGPVSWASKQFRTATFIEKFNEAQAAGKGEAEAAAIADTYVRERHGAVALHDLPSVMTSGEKGRLLTMFYGYFNTQYNLARTIPAHLRRGDTGKALEAAWGSIIVGAFFGATVANQAREEDTWLKRGAKAIPLQLLGMVPFAREFATLAIEGIPPRTPIGSVLQSVVGAGGDIKRYIEKKPIDAGVKHVAALAGLLGGVPGTLQAGRTGQFLWDVNKGKQRPRDMMEWARGIMTGEAKLKHKGER